MVITDTNYIQINNHIEGVLQKDILKDKIIKDCPHCNSIKIIKHGSYKNGQRYKCKDCLKTFCKRTFTPFYYTKKDTYTWMRFVELMLENTTLRGCSKHLGVDLTTAFYWRHKILRTLIKVREADKLVDYIEMTKVSIKENFKGSRNIPEGERKDVWTIIAEDKNEGVVSRPICKTRWSQENFKKIIYSKVDEKSYLSTYGDRFIWSISRKHNEGKQVIVSNNILRNYVRSLKLFMKRFYGVASKYLTHYLYFSNIFLINDSFDTMSLLYKIADFSSYIKCKSLKKLEVVVEY